MWNVSNSAETILEKCKGDVDNNCHKNTNIYINKEKLIKYFYSRILYMRYSIKCCRQSSQNTSCCERQNVKKTVKQTTIATKAVSKQLAQRQLLSRHPDSTFQKLCLIALGLLD